MTVIPATIDDVTPDWLTVALRRAGLDVEVRQIDAVRIGTGQIGASYRLTPTYAGPARGPDTFVLKLAVGDEDVRRRVAGGFVKEVGFYSTLRDRVAVRTPRCWHASIADDTLTFSLLLDDLAPKVPGVQRDGCSVDQARDALRNLAALHAPRWNDPDLLAIDFLTPAEPAVADFLGAIYIDLVAGFVERFAGDLQPEEVATLLAVGPVLGSWLVARPKPFTIVHGDYRLDNLMFPLEGDGVMTLDWQTVSAAPPARDVAYFLGNSLDTELRRAHEHDLVQSYVGALQMHGVDDYSAEACFEDYRFGQLQGPMITVLGCMVASSSPTPASNEMFLTMARRSCAAIEDLASLQLVAGA